MSIYSFLWGSSEERKKKGYYLIDWQLLARPLVQGGWGIKHLPLFCLSLRMKTFWFALNQPGIWNQLLSAKYMKNLSLHTWCRCKNFRYWNVSIIWKGFINSLHWIGKGLIWQVGDGSAIRVGANPIVGFGGSFILSAELRTYLEDYGICTLDQAINHASGHWFSAEELDLCEEWSILWKSYIRGLE